MPSSPARVLYIDDDPELALLVQRTLGRRGYAVENVASGEAGLARLAEGGVDVIALDHFLSIGTGLDFLESLRELCGEYGCVDKVVVCAPGYHIIYGNRCVVNIHSPPSWEDQVQPVVPPCEGCWTTHPTLYELTLGQLGAVTSGASNAAHFRRGRLRRRHFCWHASCKVFEVSGVICDARTSLDLGRFAGRPFSVSRVPCILDTAAGPPVAPTAILMTGRPKGRPFLILSIGFSRPFCLTAAFTVADAQHHQLTLTR